MTKTRPVHMRAPELLEKSSACQERIAQGGLEEGVEKGMEHHWRVELAVISFALRSNICLLINGRSENMGHVMIKRTDLSNFAAYCAIEGCGNVSKFLNRS